MRNKIIYISVVCSFILFFANCSEDKFNVQYPTDNTVPQRVANVQVENLPGAVKLTYDLPDEQNLMYVKAVYPLSKGGEGETKASAFNNSMLIKGFGKSKKHTIQLITVNKNKNESKPVIVEVEPEDSPIFEIFESVDLKRGFGGFVIEWNNPLEENIIIEIMRADTITGSYDFLDIIHSAQKKGKYSIRGLDTTMVDAAVFLKDTYENYSDTFKTSVKPYFEERIPIDNLREFPIPPYFELFAGGRGPALLFNDNLSDGNTTYIRAGNPDGYMPWFTVDLGLNTVLSRLVHYHRKGYEWTLHNMREFEVWGTNSASTASEHNRLPIEWREDPNWEMLGHFKSVKPSGGGADTPPTSEDMEFILSGEEFEFEVGLPSYRYLRFNIISTWSNSTGFQSRRVLLYGEVDF